MSHLWRFRNGRVAVSVGSLHALNDQTPSAGRVQTCYAAHAASLDRFSAARTHLLPGAAAETYFTNRMSPESRSRRFSELAAAGTLMTPESPLVS